MLPATAERVRSNTEKDVNEDIARRTEESIARFANADTAAIERRLAELDLEWDVERTLETIAPSFTLFGLIMGITSSRKWLLLPIAVQSFFLQHALQGWCPPLPVLRRLGIRTADEINHERYALKALRGNFEDVSAENALEAARP